MENKTETITKKNRLEQLLLISWYVTIGSAAFGEYLLRFALPIGGHFFLFRGAILLTCLLYVLMLFCRRENPFRGLSRIELCFVATAVCMLGYSLVSIAWSLSLGAWFSKFFTMCQMFALVFLFLKLCRDEKVLRVTLLLTGATTLFCTLGGFVECFHGPFFDTPYRDYAYVFFNKHMYAPVFTFYNPNGFSVYILFIVEILYLYMAFHWEQPASFWNRRLLYILSAWIGLSLFLCCADGGRLCVLSLPIILCGLAVWLALRYKRGLTVFLGLALCLALVYVGENYEMVKYRAAQAEKQIQEFFTPDDASSVPEDTPSPNTPAGPDDEPPPNIHSTLGTVTPAVTDFISGELTDESGGIRMALLKNSLQMLMESKGLGIGLGNAEIRMAEFDNANGTPNVHCFIMEVLLEMGIFALIPLLVLVFLICKALCSVLYTAVKSRRWESTANPLFLLFTIVTYVFLSTANSSSWGIAAMWLYTALVLLYSGRMERLPVNSDERVNS